MTKHIPREYTIGYARGTLLEWWSDLWATLGCFGLVVAVWGIMVLLSALLGGH